MINSDYTNTKIVEEVRHNVYKDSNGIRLFNQSHFGIENLGLSNWEEFIDSNDKLSSHTLSNTLTHHIGTYPGIGEYNTTYSKIMAEDSGKADDDHCANLGVLWVSSSPSYVKKAYSNTKRLKAHNKPVHWLAIALSPLMKIKEIDCNGNSSHSDGVLPYTKYKVIVGKNTTLIIVGIENLDTNEKSRLSYHVNAQQRPNTFIDRDSSDIEKICKSLGLSVYMALKKIPLSFSRYQTISDYFEKANFVKIIDKGIGGKIPFFDNYNYVNITEYDKSNIKNIIPPPYNLEAKTIRHETVAKRWNDYMFNQAGEICHAVRFEVGPSFQSHNDIIVDEIAILHPNINRNKELYTVLGEIILEDNKLKFNEF